MRPRLILIPGLLCDHELWADQIRGLRELANVQVADLRHGASISLLADRILAEAPARFSLAGLSMGGYVAFEIMRKAPERVERLAIFDSTARPDSPQQKRRRRLLVSLSRRGAFSGVTDRLLPLLVHPARVEDPVIRKAVGDMAIRVGRDSFARQQTAIMNRIDSRPFLSAISCPTMIVCGRDDAITPTDLAQEMAGLIPRARLAVIPDCGHLSTLEKPAETTALMTSWLHRSL